MGGKSGGGSSPAPSGNTTSTQTSTPWSGQQPYLSQVMGAAQGLYNNYTPQYFSGSTVAPWNPNQTQGNNLEAQFGAAGGASSVNQANSYLGGLEHGDYLGTNPENNMLSQYTNGSMLSSGNPNFQNMVGQIGQSIAPQIDSHFAANGRYGSGANANAFADSLSKEAGNLAYQNYNQGQDRQIAAAGQVGQNYQNDQGNMIRGAFIAPGIQQGQLQGIGALQDAGNQQQTQSQAQLNDQINRFNFQQQLPYNQLGNYSSMIQGNYGGQSTMTQPYYQNQGANALGGALGGGALGAMMSSNPWTIGAGALGGGVLSAFK